MAFKIVLTDLFSFKVEGSTNDEKGVAQPFDFVLKAVRLDEKDIQAKLDDGGSVMEFLADLVRGWDGPRDESDKPIPFTPEAFKSLGSIPGLAKIMLKGYLLGVGAKEKN